MEGLSGSGGGFGSVARLSGSGERVNSHWPSNVLDVLLAPALEGALDLTLDLFVNLA